MAACGKKCDREKDCDLAGGHTVCSYCPEWMIECEAIDTLNKPLRDRQWFLTDVEKARGFKAADQLKQRMIEIHSIRKLRR